MPMLFSPTIEAAITAGYWFTRLEAKENKKPGVIVVSGYSEAEYELTIADLIENGAAHERDLFVCLMRFGERPH
jgi:hypothetical protein